MFADNLILQKVVDLDGSVLALDMRKVNKAGIAKKSPFEREPDRSKGDNMCLKQYLEVKDIWRESVRISSTILFLHPDIFLGRDCSTGRRIDEIPCETVPEQEKRVVQL